MENTDIPKWKSMANRVSPQHPNSSQSIKYSWRDGTGIWM